MPPLLVFWLLLSVSAATFPNAVGEPVSGKIWSSADQRFIPEDRLFEAIAPVEMVMLGETHDNPVHHAIQARLLSALTGAGRRPALVWEMVERRQQPLLVSATLNQDNMGRLLQWERRGWPDFSYYRPLAATAFDYDLPQFAGNIDRQTVRAMIRHGQSALPGILRRMMALPDLDAAAAQPLIQEIVSAHCDMLSPHTAKPMVEIQRARDASLALAMMAGAELSGDGAVLIAGTMHLRRATGVPAHLSRLGATSSLVSIVPWEVGEQAAEVPHTSGFDYIWFTDTARREDPCARFARHMKNKSQGPQNR